MTSIKYEIKEIDVIPDYNGLQNVIRRVVWEAHFYEPAHPDITACALIITILDIDEINPNAFIAINQLPKETVIGWCMDKQGGIDWLNAEIRTNAEEHLAERLLYVDTVPYDVTQLQP